MYGRTYSAQCALRKQMSHSMGIPWQRLLGSSGSAVAQQPPGTQGLTSTLPLKLPSHCSLP